METMNISAVDVTANETTASISTSAPKHKWLSIVILKVLAKKNVSVSATLLAYASDGSVIGKSSDDITLTKDKYNFFRYSFDGDVSSANIQANAHAKKDSFMTGERNAVEMVQYNQSGDDLYVTFEQTGDELGSFAKSKLMFYKGDRIVDTEDGYFNIYAENLNGRVRQMWLRSGCTVRTMTGSNMCMSRDSQSFNNTGILLSAGIMPITGIIILLHLLEKVLMSS